MAYQPFGAGTSGDAGEAGDIGGAGDTGLGTDAHFLGGNNGSVGDSGGSGRDARGDEFDASIHIDPDKRNADGSYRKKRGRKSNTAANRSRTKADHTASVESLAFMIATLHMGIATISKTPELNLNAEESEKLAAASARMLEAFDIRASEKAEAIAGMITAAGAVYVPKAYFIKERLKEEKAIRVARENERANYQ